MGKDKKRRVFSPERYPENSPMLDKKYPRLWAYLKANEKVLRARENGKYGLGEEKGWRWYDLARPQSLQAAARKNKLLLQTTAITPEIAVDTQGVLFAGSGTHNAYGLSLSDYLDARFCAGVFAADPTSFHVKHTSSVFGGGYYSFGDQFIKELPIPEVADDLQAQIIQLVTNLTTKSDESSKLQRKLEHFPESVTESLREHKKTPDLESFANLASGHSPFNSDLRHHKDTRIETNLMGETVLLIPKGKTGHTEIRGTPSFLAIVRATLEQRKKISRNDLLALPIPERENVQRDYIQTLQHWKNDLERLQNEIETLETELNDAVYLAFDLDVKDRAVIESFLERF